MVPTWTFPPGSRNRFRQFKPMRRKSSRKLPGWTNNAVVSAVIAALVAGLISWVTASEIANRQSQADARQAISGEQVQQVVLMKSDAAKLYQALLGAVSDTTSCVRQHNQNACEAASTFNNSHTAETLMDEVYTDAENISSRMVVNDVNQFYGLAYDLQEDLIGGVAAPDSPIGKAYVLDFGRMGAIYDRLNTDCGQFIQGKA
jgi:hypothetical protein